MTSDHQIQSSTLPAPQPDYVLRGHSAQIHSVCFLRHNTRLLTGDAQGWLVLWSLASKRPVAVWRAHEGAILGLGSWNDDKIITHGRDTKLLVWQLRESDEPMFSTILPIEDDITRRAEPWLLQSLEVNTLNFCSFAQCPANALEKNDDDASSIFLAVPGRREGEVEIYSLPSQERLFTIGAPKGIKTGMVMALKITYLVDDLTVIAGFESGHTCLWHKPSLEAGWKTAYIGRVHEQPVLSLDMAETHSAYFTSAADALVARHPLTIADTPVTDELTKQVQTKHSGQQALRVRSDEKVFATAGWDGRIRVYSVKTMRELAVLKWHKQGCYALAFADLSHPVGTVLPDSHDADDSAGKASLEPYLTVEQKRNIKAQTTHWLAAGAKDGKVSLWDIY
ncbi:hypothetical protein AAFC00_001840 [Neodothiora populina]|uniref:ASTRA-associated protein 1 n=1 Tax=Neodothiora populina TaxID=2781224 RepID=A0ABR3PQA5_9PEZI